MFKTAAAERTSKHTPNSIISTAGDWWAEANRLCIFSCADSELEDRRDGGCNNCWFDVDVVLVIFSCRQSRTVYCVEAFVSSPSWLCVCGLHGLACLLCKRVSVRLSARFLVMNRPLSRRQSKCVCACALLIVIVMSCCNLSLFYCLCFLCVSHSLFISLCHPLFLSFLLHSTVHHVSCPNYSSLPFPSILLF